MKHDEVILLLALLLPASAALRAWGAPGPLRVTGETPSQRGPDTRDTIAASRGNAVAPECSVTEHTILVQGHPIHYRATAGYLPIRRDSGQRIANIFFVAYERLDRGDAGDASDPQSAMLSPPAATGGRNPQSKNWPLSTFKS